MYKAKMIVHNDDGERVKEEDKYILLKKEPTYEQFIRIEEKCYTLRRIEWFPNYLELGSYGEEAVWVKQKDGMVDMHLHVYQHSKLSGME